MDNYNELIERLINANPIRIWSYDIYSKKMKRALLFGQTTFIFKKRKIKKAATLYFFYIISNPNKQYEISENTFKQFREYFDNNQYTDNMLMELMHEPAEIIKRLKG